MRAHQLKPLEPWPLYGILLSTDVCTLLSPPPSKPHCLLQPPSPTLRVAGSKYYIRPSLAAFHPQSINAGISLTSVPLRPVVVLCFSYLCSVPANTRHITYHRHLLPLAACLRISLILCMLSKLTTLPAYRSCLVPWLHAASRSGADRPRKSNSPDHLSS